VSLGKAANQEVVRDLTARGVSCLAEWHIETVVELLDDGIVVMGDDGGVKLVNPAAMRILHLTPDHLAADFAARAATSRLMTRTARSSVM
jgi:PAS domain-containing protein